MQPRRLQCTPPTATSRGHVAAGHTADCAEQCNHKWSVTAAVGHTRCNLVDCGAHHRPRRAEQAASRAITSGATSRPWATCCTPTTKRAHRAVALGRYPRMAAMAVKSASRQRCEWGRSRRQLTSLRSAGHGEVGSHDGDGVQRKEPHSRSVRRLPFACVFTHTVVNALLDRLRILPLSRPPARRGLRISLMELSLRTCDQRACGEQA